MLRRRKSHDATLQHIAALEAQDEVLDERIDAIQNLPAEIVADGLDEAELRSYQASATVERIIQERATRVQNEHPLSGGRQRPPRNIPVLDDAYFEARRTPYPLGFGYAFPASAGYSASILNPVAAYGASQPLFIGTPEACPYCDQDPSP